MVLTYMSTCGRFHFTLTEQVAVMIDLLTGDVSTGTLSNFQLVIGQLIEAKR